jgi:hypothetical protein
LYYGADPKDNHSVDWTDTKETILVLQ